MGGGGTLPVQDFTTNSLVYNTNWCNDFYIQFRQNFAKETFSYDEHLKS